MQISSLYSIFKSSKGVCTDTRKIAPGSIFFALKGSNFDGNQYAFVAIEKGCSHAVVDDPTIQGDNIIHVPDVLKALQSLANYHRHALQAKVIAITGSNGKTTTKELLYEIIKLQFKVTATPGNFNNHIGLPLTILSAPADTEILILEMGDNQPGDIAELCAIAEPELGLITNIGKDHLGGYENGFEGNILAKKELFDYLRTTDKIAFVNASDKLLMNISDDVNRILYGEPNSMLHIELEPSANFLTFKSLVSGICTTQLVGEYNLYNIESAYCIARYLEIPDEIIEASISNYQPENNRSQLVQTIFNSIVLDAYNANPSSVELALESLKNMKVSKKIAILGDMLELGEASKDEHQNMIDLAAQLEIKAFFVGKIYSQCKFHSNQFIFDSKEALVQHINSNPIKEATILLKGSRSMKMEELLSNL